MPLHGCLDAGKIPPSVLRDVVFQNTGADRREVLVKPGIGEDTTIIDVGQEYVVASTDPITGADNEAGWLGVKVALNDLAAAGAEPVCVLVTLLLPLGSTKEDLSQMMKDIDRACKEERVSLAGGHSEVTSAVKKPIISVTALGKSVGKKPLSASNAKVGDDILVTKWAGMEATSILVKDFRHVFQKHLNSDDIKTAEDLMSQISVVPEGRIAARCNASACHDATEGGVLGAIYELAQASGKGATVWLEKIPVLPITKIVAEIAKVDPLRMVSSGCLVVCTKNGERLKSTYLSAGINAEVVGKITSGESRLIGYCKESPLEAPGPDELYKARAYLETISHPKG